MLQNVIIYALTKQQYKGINYKTKYNIILSKALNNKNKNYIIVSKGIVSILACNLASYRYSLYFPEYRHRP